MKDGYGREIDYMRISITDRCNLRCRYCMPEGIRLAPAEQILTFEEIEIICRAAVGLGIKKFKITGGEPLARPGCPELIGMIKAIPGTEQVTLTTNGVLLGQYLDRLKANGLDAVNISVDTLDPVVYEQITGFSELYQVKKNLRKAVEAGFPVKINTVLQRGMNDEEWEELVSLTQEMPVDVRFIEMMPIGYGKQCAGVPGKEILQKLREKYPDIQADSSIHGNGPAVYYRLPGGKGSIGFISAVHGRFCDSCNRIRLTAEGSLKPCLCYGEGINVRSVIRSVPKTENGECMTGRTVCVRDDVEQMLCRAAEVICEAIQKKPQMHCFDTEASISEKRKMVQIGG